MPLIGIEKDKYNWVDHRIRQQKEFWPDFVRQWDEEQKGKRFRAEFLSLTDLWNLYVGGAPEVISEEEDARGKKPEKKKKSERGYEVIPIRAFELPGRYSERGQYHETEHGYLRFDQWLYARDQARKDLFFLCKEYKLVPDVEPDVHQVVCDQFVAKMFDGAYPEGYTLKQFQTVMNRLNRVPHYWIETMPFELNTLGDFGKYMPDPVEDLKEPNKARTMILLDPRGFFKSFIDAADTVQWIINAPDIRILIMSGVYKLTAQFLQLVKSHFYLPKGMKPKQFHLLFPEFVIRGIDGTSKENLRIKESCSFLASRLQHESPDPTMGIISIGSSLSGFHCDVLKFDDIVTDDNCNKDETREALREKANGAVNLMMEWSWHDIIGTRYFPDDFYGVTEAKFKDNPEDFNLKFFKRAAWTVKPEYEDRERGSLFDLTEDMVELTFPKHRSFKALRKMLRENERSFRCQQLNQPVWGENNSIHFPAELLRSRIKSPLEVQQRMGEVVGAIDTAREDKSHSDYTALVVAKIYRDIPQMGADGLPFQTLAQVYESSLMAQAEEGKEVIMVIMDVQFGRWSQTEIAHRIAAVNNQWRPKRWIGEDSGGLHLLKEKINEVSRTTYGHWPAIFWIQPENNYGAKRNRIKGLETLLRSNRMFFANAAWNQEVFEQFEKYTGQKSTKYSKDDVPDATSFLTRFLPHTTPLSKREIEDMSKQKEHEYRDYLRRETKRLVFGDDSGGFGMNYTYPTFGQEQPEESRGPMKDMAKKFFGGNGLRS